VFLPDGTEMSGEQLEHRLDGDCVPEAAADRERAGPRARSCWPARAGVRSKAFFADRERVGGARCGADNGARTVVQARREHQALRWRSRIAAAAIRGITASIDFVTP
jgi:hypothetical protein